MGRSDDAFIDEEVGCGVGAQTSILARRNPGIHLTSIDISEVSVEKAGGLVSELGLKNVTVKQAKWKQGLKDLSAVSSHMEGSFFYTWFKGQATPNS